MNAVTFSGEEATLLYVMPDAPVKLSQWIRRYELLNRDAPSSYEVLCELIRKALSAGVLVRTDAGEFALTDDWHARIHQWDTQCPDSSDAMLEFERYLVSRTWLVAAPSEFVLDRTEYIRCVGMEYW